MMNNVSRDKLGWWNKYDDDADGEMGLGERIDKEMSGS